VSVLYTQKVRGPRLEQLLYFRPSWSSCCGGQN